MKHDIDQHQQTYAGMRQLLIRRLVECEAYWRNRQMQEVITL